MLYYNSSYLQYYYGNEDEIYICILERAICIFLARKARPHVHRGMPGGEQYLLHYDTVLLGLNKQEREEWASIVDNRKSARNSTTAPIIHSPQTTPILTKALELYSTEGSPITPTPPPTPQHGQVTSAVHVPLPTPSDASLHVPPDPPMHRKHSEAVIPHSTGMSDDTTATRPTGCSLGNVAPSKAISGAGKQTPSVRSSLVIRTTSTQGTGSQPNRGRGNGAKKSNNGRGHTVSAAIAKGSTTVSPASRLVSKISSQAPGSRSSPALNTRGKDSTKPGTKPVWRG